MLVDGGLKFSSLYLSPPIGKTAGISEAQPFNQYKKVGVGYAETNRLPGGVERDRGNPDPLLRLYGVAMLNPNAEKSDQREKLLSVVKMDRDEVIEFGDRISKLAKHAPTITAKCLPGRALQVRRLLTIPANVWKNYDVTIAKAVVTEIKILKKDNTYQNTLALACLGVRRRNLDLAMASLEKQALEAAEKALDGLQDMVDEVASKEDQKEEKTES